MKIKYVLKRKVNLIDQPASARAWSHIKIIFKDKDMTLIGNEACNLFHKKT